MEKELKVGQRIELFKILEECRYDRELLPVGCVRAGYNIESNICEMIPDLTSWGTIGSVHVCHTEFEYNVTNHPVDVKPIGAFIIKTLKPKHENS